MGQLTRKEKIICTLLAMAFVWGLLLLAAVIGNLLK
jgi:hypothetical protein